MICNQKHSRGFRRGSVFRVRLIFREEVVETLQLSDSSLVFSLTSLLCLKHQVLVLTIYVLNIIHFLSLESEDLGSRSSLPHCCCEYPSQLTLLNFSFLIYKIGILTISLGV